jgi:hypothetical protein
MSEGGLKGGNSDNANEQRLRNKRNERNKRKILVVFVYFVHFVYFVISLRPCLAAATTSALTTFAPWAYTVHDFYLLISGGLFSWLEISNGCASAATRRSASPLDLRVEFHVPCASNMDSEPHRIISFNSLQHPS